MPIRISQPPGPRATTIPPPSDRAPGSDVEVLLRAGVLPYATWQQQQFLDMYQAGPTTPDGQRLARPTVGRHPIQEQLRALSEIAPAGLSREEAQRLLDQPFEWRASFGGSFPAALLNGSAPDAAHQWLDRTPAEVAAMARQALADAGVRGIEVEPGPQYANVGAARRTLPGLVLRHQVGANHWGALQAFHRAWQRVSPSLPPIELRGVMPTPTGDAPGKSPIDEHRPILERFGEFALGRFQPLPDGITSREHAVLQRWVEAVHGLELPRHAAHRGLMALMTCPLRELTAALVQLTLDAHVQLGTLSPFAAQMLTRYHQEYRAAAATRPAKIRLDTHLKFDGVPYIVFQQLFAPRGGTELVASEYSGAVPMRLLAELNGINVSVPPQPSISYVKPVDVPKLPRPGEPCLVMERAGEVASHWALHHRPEEIRAALAEGRVKLISHNAADDARLTALLGGAPPKRLKTTAMKQHEAQLVGQRQILQAAEYCREVWQRPIADSHVVVVGAGTIGGGAVDAALALGMAPQRILVVDLDPAVRAHYAGRGCRVFDTLQAGGDAAAGLDLERVVLIHATNASLMNPANVFQFGRDTLLFSLTSDGRGVDWSAAAPDTFVADDEPIFAPGFRGRLGGQWVAGYDQGAQRIMKQDVRLWHAGRQARIIAGGYPPNLLEEQWHDRFQLVPTLVIGAVLHAIVTDDPQAPPLPPVLDREAVALYERLDPGFAQPFRGYTDPAWAALLADFTASPAPAGAGDPTAGAAPPAPFTAYRRQARGTP